MIVLYIMTSGVEVNLEDFTKKITKLNLMNAICMIIKQYHIRMSAVVLNISIVVCDS